MITQIEPQELESIISRYENVKGDVVIMATPFAIPKVKNLQFNLFEEEG